MSRKSEIADTLPGTTENRAEAYPAATPLLRRPAGDRHLLSKRLTGYMSIS